MVECFTIKLPGTAPVKFSILQLTGCGKELCRALGVEPVESDWEKIVRLYKGEEQEGHAALVLMVAYQDACGAGMPRSCPSTHRKRPGFSPI